MKKYLFLLSLSVLAFSGCKKRQVCQKCEMITYDNQVYATLSYCGTDEEIREWKKPLEESIIPGYNRMECK